MGFARYLGRNEKNGFIQLVALQAATENVLREIELSKGADKAYLRYLRTGRSWLEKAVNLRLANLDPDAALDFAKQSGSILWCSFRRMKQSGSGKNLSGWAVHCILAWRISRMCIRS